MANNLATNDPTTTPAISARALLCEENGFILHKKLRTCWDRLVYQKVLRLLNMSNIAAKLLDTNRIHQSKKTSETTNHKARI